jgi:hypothetical protein
MQQKYFSKKKMQQKYKDFEGVYLLQYERSQRNLKLLLSSA